MKTRIIATGLVLLLVNALQAQFISEVLEFTPAPGQFINKGPWGMPDNHNTDVSIVGRLDGAMSLGAFGGYVVFKFAEPVKNHPDNPYGIDFVIYGNPLKNISTPEVSNRVTWSEPGIVYVMKDDNGNGLPDDTWYELAGSDYFFSSTIKNYEVTYTNPNRDVATDVPWTDNYENTGFVFVNNFHKQPYYPSNANFPHINEQSYTLKGTKIQDYVDRTNPSYVTSFGRPWGYADNTLRARYNGLPDNPYTRGMDIEEEGSGGDAFDIGWAVDTNGNYVNLDEVDFIKVQNGVLADGGWLGEISTEITGAFVVSPDETISGELDMIIIKELPSEIVGTSFQLEAFAYHKGRWDKDRTINWTSSLGNAYVNSKNQLVFTSSGKVVLTASLADRPEITETVKTVLVYEDNPSSIELDQKHSIRLYPNPAASRIFISGAEYASVEIYSATGNRVLIKHAYSDNQPLAIAHLSKGIYVVKVKGLNFNKTIRFVKE